MLESMAGTDFVWKANTICEVPDDEAETFIERGMARELTEEEAKLAESSSKVTVGRKKKASE